MHIIQMVEILNNITSKSVYGFEETNDLFIWNMVMHETRKATCKKVRLWATVRDGNLWTSQGTMCRKEIYNTSLQDFADFLKISVVAVYNLIGCVINHFQRW